MSVGRDHSVVTPLTQVTLTFTETFTDKPRIKLVSGTVTSVWSQSEPQLSLFTPELFSVTTEAVTGWN